MDIHFIHLIKRSFQIKFQFCCSTSECVKYANIKVLGYIFKIVTSLNELVFRDAAINRGIINTEI